MKEKICFKCFIFDFLNKNQFYEIKIGYQFLMSGLIPKMNKVLCEFDGPEFLGE